MRAVVVTGQLIDNNSIVLFGIDVDRTEHGAPAQSGAPDRPSGARDPAVRVSAMRGHAGLRRPTGPRSRPSGSVWPLRLRICTEAADEIRSRLERDRAHRRSISTAWDDLGVSPVDWSAFDGPADYDPASVPRALDAIANASGRSEARDASIAVLSAIGNNHGGTIYPAALAAVPIIIGHAASPSGWSRRAAAEILLDLATSFVAEPGYEEARTADGEIVNLRQSVIDLITGAANQISEAASISVDGDNDTPPPASAAQALLSLTRGCGENRSDR